MPATLTIDRLSSLPGEALTRLRQLRILSVQGLMAYMADSARKSKLKDELGLNQDSIDAVWEEGKQLLGHDPSQEPRRRAVANGILDMGATGPRQKIR